MRAFRVKQLLWLLLLSPLLLAGCDNDDDPPPPVTLSSISVSPSAVPDGLPVNSSQQFTAKGTYTDGSVQDLTTTASWNSSDTNVASINTSGLATGLTAGATSITASNSGVTSSTVALNVINPNLLSITVSPPSVPNPVPVGSTVQFNAEGLFDNNKSYDITSYVTWATSPTGVLSIDTTGLATADTAGTTSVTASTTTPALTSNAVSVTTEAAVEAELIIEPQIAEPLPANRTRQLLAILRYANESLEDVTNDSTWSSSDTAVATVNSSGLVTGIATGDATITATHNSASGRSDALPITVNDATILSVKIDPELPAVLPKEGFNQAFVATGLFSDDEFRPLAGPLSWSVSDTDIASLQTITGREIIAVVEGLQEGSVDVIYTDYLADGAPSGFSDEVALTITSGVLDSMEIQPDSDGFIPAGMSVGFVAIGTFDDGNTRNITGDVIWVSSDTSVGVFDTRDPGELQTLTSAVGLSTDVKAQMTNINGVEIETATVNVTLTATLLDRIVIQPVAGVVVGETRQYTATGVFDNGDLVDYTERVTWASTDRGIATVSNAEGKNGQLTGVEVGTASITITDPESGEQDVQDIVVSQQ